MLRKPYIFLILFAAFVGDLPDILLQSCVYVLGKNETEQAFQKFVDARFQPETDVDCCCVADTVTNVKDIQSHSHLIFHVVIFF